MVDKFKDTSSDRFRDTTADRFRGKDWTTTTVGAEIQLTGLEVTVNLGSVSVTASTVAEMPAPAAVVGGWLFLQAQRILRRQGRIRVRGTSAKIDLGQVVASVGANVEISGIAIANETGNVQITTAVDIAIKSSEARSRCCTKVVVSGCARILIAGAAAAWTTSNRIEAGAGPGVKTSGFGMAHGIGQMEAEASADMALRGATLHVLLGRTKPRAINMPAIQKDDEEIIAFLLAA